MAESTVQIVREVTSSTSAAVASTPVRVSGMKVTFQSVAPDALITIQISNDGVNWVTATNEENTDIASVQSLTESIKERSDWVRVSVATDSGGPQLYRVVFSINKVN